MSRSDPNRADGPAPPGGEQRGGSRHTRANRLGIVVIGRNEGERLERSLRSVGADSPCLVYVDSGSSDGSVELGRQLAAAVVELDDSEPFTAARARNAGLQRLLEIDGSLAMVQFVDGDCELEPKWLNRAQAALAADASLAAVCGRLRERRPDASPYARLSQMEWNRPVGDTLACGGIAMFRVEPLLATGGFNASMIAGEESELCHRLRRAGWRIERLDDAMAVHDGGMISFQQWWVRAVRSGHAYAENSMLQAEPGSRGAIRPVASMLLWGVLAPVLALGGALLTAWFPWAILLPLAIACAYGLLFARIHRSARESGESHRHAVLYALFCVLAKLPHCIGAARYWLARARGRRNALIEYKSAAGNS